MPICKMGKMPIHCLPGGTSRATIWPLLNTSVAFSVSGESFVILPLQRMTTKLSGRPGIGTGWRKRKHKESRWLMAGDECGSETDWPFVSSATMSVQWQHPNTSSLDNRGLVDLWLMCLEQRQWRNGELIYFYSPGHNSEVKLLDSLLRCNT